MTPISQRCISCCLSPLAFFGGQLELGPLIGKAQIGVLELTTVSPDILALISIPKIALLVSALILSMRLYFRYIDEPWKAVGTQLLLGTGVAIISKFISAAILFAYVATATNPFTLPFMATVGASALCMAALYWISRPNTPDAPGVENDGIFVGKGYRMGSVIK